MLAGHLKSLGLQEALQSLTFDFMAGMKENHPRQPMKVLTACGEAPERRNASSHGGLCRDFESYLIGYIFTNLITLVVSQRYFTS